MARRELSTELGRQLRQAVEAEMTARDVSYGDLGQLMGISESRVREMFGYRGWGIDPACEVAEALEMTVTLEIASGDRSYAVSLTPGTRSRPSALAERELVELTYRRLPSAP